MVEINSGDLDSPASQDKVAHEAATNTDHSDASVLKQGYSYAESSVFNDQAPFASNGASQPYGGIHDPEVIYNSNAGKSFFIWQGTNLDPYAVEYDYSAGSYSSPVQVGTNPLSSDDHGTPAIVQDANGIIHAFYGPHGQNGALNHATSDNANDATSWTEQSDITTDCTYSVPRNINGDLYVFLRLYNGGEKNRTGYVKSTDDGSTWGSKTPIATVATDSWAYHVSVAVDGSDVHVTIMRMRKDQTGDPIHKIYHVIYNTTDSTVYSIDGTSLGSEATQTELENNALVYDAGSNEVKTLAGGLDGNGRPHFVFQSNVSGSWEYVYMYWDGSSWTTPTTITSSSGNPHAGGLRVNSATNIDALLITNSGATSGKDGDIEEYHYDGSSWSQSRVLVQESNFSNGFSNPLYVSGAPSSLDISFPQVDTGDYSNADLGVYGYGDDGIVAGPGTSPVRWWPLHEDSGTTVYDISDNGDDATSHSATVNQPAILNTTGYDFDGANTYIDSISTPTALQGGSSSFSVTCWFKPTSGFATSSGNNNRRDILSAVGGGDDNFAFGTRDADGDGNAELWMYADAGGNTNIDGSTALSADTWYFLGCTYDAGTYTVYVDGSSDGSTTSGSGSSINSTSNPLRIGYGGESYNDYLYGRLTDLRVWTDVLSGSQMQTLNDIVRGSGNLITTEEVI